MSSFIECQICTLEWCPFLMSQLKKCQISDTSHWLVPNETKICLAGLMACKNLKISVTLSARKKKDSIFLKICFEREFLKDMKIYQKKTN